MLDAPFGKLEPKMLLTVAGQSVPIPLIKLDHSFEQDLDGKARKA